MYDMQKTNSQMAEVNHSLSVLTSNVNDLNSSVKRQRWADGGKNTMYLYVVNKRLIVDKKTQRNLK